MIFKIKKFLKILSSVTYIKGLLYGVAASVEHERLIKNISPKFIVDIGANKGQFALMLRKINPNSTIHSFEPLGNAVNSFRKIFKNDSNINIYPFAIGNSKEDKNIFISMRDDSSSILPISKNQEEIYPGTGLKETAIISIDRLDNHIGIENIIHPSLLKIDVQGFELEVLKGSENLLGSFSYIYCECSFIELYEGQPIAYEIIDFLAQLGFYLDGIHNLHHNEKGVSIQADFLFKNLNKLP